jgi:hypothetical protein
MKLGQKLTLSWVLLLLMFFGLCGCDIYTDTEDMRQQKTWGDTVEISYEFNVLDIIKRGPYKLQVTPMGVVELEVKGKAVDCIEIQYQLLSTNDGKPALYADCVSPVDFLTDSFSEVAHGVWYTDREGTLFKDVRSGTLNVGIEYTFYVPLRKSLEESGLHWITLSDRSYYHSRTGTTYWYRVK